MHTLSTRAAGRRKRKEKTYTLAAMLEAELILLVRPGMLGGWVPKKKTGPVPVARFDTARVM